MNENELSKDERYPITAIYFLGFRLKNVKFPVLKVERQYVNAISKRKLNVKKDFVEKLSHDLYAIQIPRLKMQVRTKLEQTSDVFNQSKDKTTDPRVARIIKYLGHVSVYNPDLHYKIIMGSCMEAEAELERHAIKQTEKRIKEAKKENAFLKKELKSLRAQLQNKQ